VSNEEQKDALESEMVRKLIKDLGEHFDCVVVLCSRHDGEDGTRTISQGSGNWHTRLGLVREFVINTEEGIRQEAIEQSKEDKP